MNPGNWAFHDFTLVYYHTHHNWKKWSHCVRDFPWLAKWTLWRLNGWSKFSVCKFVGRTHYFVPLVGTDGTENVHVLLSLLESFYLQSKLTWYNRMHLVLVFEKWTEISDTFALWHFDSRSQQHYSLTSLWTDKRMVMILGVIWTICKDTSNIFWMICHFYEFYSCGFNKH